MNKSILRGLRAIALVLALGAFGPPALRAQNLNRPRPSAPIAAGRAAPEADGVVDLPRLTGPIVLDGFSDEAAWAEVDPVALTMYEPTFRGASERTIQVKVAYDDEAIYVAARFYHDDPEVIRAFSLTRDRWSGDDGFGILLDTFNDNENAVRFVGLPLGARMDMSITGDGQQDNNGSGGPRGSSWNTYWDLETEITDEGWFGEMRIPLSSLRFETKEDGSVVMGLMTYAYEPLGGARWTFPAIPRSRPYTQVSAWQDVRLTGIAPTNPIYLSPYILTGRNQRAVLPDGGSSYSQFINNSYEVGADLKINPTPNLTLDLTVNTDFAAVEADQQQVNLTRFSLFFDEKRQFFQERAGIFGFATGTDRGTLFYSRRIGLSQGQPVPILGGARLVGRVGGWDVGLIEMQTANHEGQPSENFGVLRLRRQVFNANSFVGAMGTSRLASGGLYNVTYGIDGQFRIVGDEYVSIKWLQTIQGGDDLLNATPSGLDAGRVVLDWRRRRIEGFSYANAFVWSGAGYNPGVGFESRNNFSRGQSDWNYQWFPGEMSLFRRVWLGATNNVWIRNADDRVDTGQLQPFLQLETKVGTQVKVSSNTTYEDVPADFALSDDVGIPEGSYWATEGAVEFRAPRRWTIRPNVTVTAGDFFDGQRLSVKTNFNWAMNRHLELIGGWERNRIRFQERGREFNSNLLRLTARGAVDTHLSIDTFLQYNSLNDQVTTNARLRYNFVEGRDLWLVWNEGINLEREILGVPRLPRTSARTLTMKYTHTMTR